MSTTQTQSDMLDERVAGDYLGGIPPRTMRQWRYLGTGPRYVKVGRAVRYRRADLDTYMASRAVTPGN